MTGRSTWADQQKVHDVHGDEKSHVQGSSSVSKTNGDKLSSAGQASSTTKDKYNGHEARQSEELRGWDSSLRVNIDGELWDQEAKVASKGEARDSGGSKRGRQSDDLVQRRHVKKKC